MVHVCPRVRREEEIRSAHRFRRSLRLRTPKFTARAGVVNQACLPPVFANKVLVGHSHAHRVHILQDCVAHKA